MRFWRRKKHRCDGRRAEWIYVDNGTKGRLYCWACNAWLTQVLPIAHPKRAAPIPAPDPCCPHETQLDAAVRDLARAHGRPVGAERVARGMATGSSGEVPTGRATGGLVPPGNQRSLDTISPGLGDQIISRRRLEAAGFDGFAARFAHGYQED